MIPCSGYGGRRVGVLGLARSGMAAARALKAGGATPVCWDDAPERRAAADAEGFEIGDPTRADVTGGLAALVVSPGVPHLYPTAHPAIVQAWAQRTPVDNDVGLFFAATAALGVERAKIVAVTGSNGKSTTTALIAHLLEQAGRPAAAGGNIGRAVFDLPPLGPDGVYVLELSSYQTDLARLLSPDVAVFTNLTPDHLDRHGGLGGYFAAKRRLFERAGAAAVGVDEPEGRALAAALPVERTLRISAAPGVAAEIRAANAELIEAGAVVARLDSAKGLLGVHNWQNAALAFAATRGLGLSAARIQAGFDSFPGLPHRLQRIAERADGVVFVNDSKATNADAAEKALLAYARVRWIAGGRAKEGGIAKLRPLLGRVAKTYLIGEAAESFAEALGDAPHALCGELETAVRQAAAEAAPGEAVLLAPAAASFDQFSDFEARGRAFEQIVAALLKEPSRSQAKDRTD